MSVADEPCAIGNADEANVDTLELELGPQEMVALTRAGARRQGAISSIDPPALPSPIKSPVARDLNRVSVQIAVALALALAELGGVWELSSVSDGPVATSAAAAEVNVPAAKPSSPLAPAERLPVRFTNPFDASEVFEFPPGTSKTEAHDAVADLLLQRARDRQPLIAKMKRVLQAETRTPRAMTAQNSSRPHGMTATASTSQAVISRATAD